MVLTKTQSKIMQLFVSNITDLFSINGVANTLKMNVSLTHRSITPLIKNYGLLKVNKQNLILLNYEENHGELAYAEYLRRKDFLAQPKNNTIADFRKEIMDKLDDEYFIMILFGSSVTKTNPSDYDIFFIFENYEKVKKREKAIEIIASNHDKEFDINVVAVESIFEMASKRNQKNVFNEVLNNHIILYGDENFYRLLKNARQ